MTARRTHQLRPPNANLAGFPRWQLRRNRTFYRAHNARNGPWFFCQDGLCRFDLTAPYGTCYLGVTEDVAVREKWGAELTSWGWVPGNIVDATVVSALTLPHAGMAADLTHPDAAKFRLTREINTTPDYGLTQQWARALGPTPGQGNRALRYQARFSTGSQAHAIALFGPVGPATGPEWAPDPNPRSGAEVASELGIAVVRTPPTIRTLGASIVNPPS